MLGGFIARLLTGRSHGGELVAPGLVVVQTDDGGVILSAVRSGRAEEILLTRLEGRRLIDAIRSPGAEAPDGFAAAPGPGGGATLHISRAGREREIRLTPAEADALIAAIEAILNSLPPDDGVPRDGMKWRILDGGPFS